MSENITVLSVRWDILRNGPIFLFGIRAWRVFFLSNLKQLPRTSWRILVQCHMILYANKNISHSSLLSSSWGSTLVTFPQALSLNSTPPLLNMLCELFSVYRVWSVCPVSYQRDWWDTIFISNYGSAERRVHLFNMTLISVLVFLSFSLVLPPSLLSLLASLANHSPKLHLMVWLWMTTRH